MPVIKWQQRYDGYVPPIPFEDYSSRYADFAKLTRCDGIIEIRLHHADGPFVFSFGIHNALSRLWQDVSNDPENEVLILTGTGDRWFTGDAAALYAAPLFAEDSDYIYQQALDGTKLIETFVTAFEIPTIAVVNGPGIHTELAMLCDVTLSAEDTDFFDPHFMAGVVPGDGHLLVLQALMGTKRAAYFTYTAEPIPAVDALELGLINEILPRADLLSRAWEIARTIMDRPRFTRRLTHAVTVRPWRKLVTEDLGLHIANEVLAQLGCKEPMAMSVVIEAAKARRAW